MSGDTYVTCIFFDFVFDGVGRRHATAPEAILTHLEAVTLLTPVTESCEVLSLTCITDCRMDHWQTTVIKVLVNRE